MSSCHFCINFLTFLSCVFLAAQEHRVAGRKYCHHCRDEPLTYQHPNLLQQFLLYLFTEVKHLSEVNSQFTLGLLWKGWVEVVVSLSDMVRAANPLLETLVANVLRGWVRRKCRLQQQLSLFVLLLLFIGSFSKFLLLLFIISFFLRDGEK